MYIFFEINLIKDLGFGTNLGIYKKEINESTDFTKVIIDSFTYEVPNFLIKQEMPNSLDKPIIKKSLIFTRNIFLNKFFIPNNLILPKSRIIFENYFN